MLKLPAMSLSSRSVTWLTAWQREVSAEPDYTRRVALAKDRFSARNTAENLTFREVRKQLREMVFGNRRCAYCEHSTGDEVEHVRPKDLYPDEVFDWNNYVLSCGACNVAKSSRWAVFRAKTNKEVDVSHPWPRDASTTLTPPTPGRDLFIHPRREDPLALLTVSFATFQIIPRQKLTPDEKRRAEYTIERLALDEREDIDLARKILFDGYLDRLRRYVAHKQAGAPATELDALRGQFARMDHPMVWVEMRRKRQQLPEVDVLLTQAPEAMTWPPLL